jgi:hypothetical protein
MNPHSFGSSGFVNISTYGVYASAILVEPDDSIVVAGVNGLVFLDSGGTLNTSLGDSDGMYGRLGDEEKGSGIIFRVHGSRMSSDKYD